MLTDDEDLAELMQRAYRYALSLTHEPEAARDLVQDAAMSVSRRGGPWNIRFMTTVVRNRFIDLYRRARKVPFESLDDSVAAPLEDESVEGPVDEGLMDLILGSLKPSEREVLYLSAVEDYTTAEIAEMTGRPRGTVLSILHRTKHKLRHRLSHETGLRN